MKKDKLTSIHVKGTAVSIISGKEGDYISLTDMIRAKDGDVFISDWLRNRNTVEFLGVWESIFNPTFNYGEFAIIKSQAGLNSYKISVKSTNEVEDRYLYRVLKRAEPATQLNRRLTNTEPQNVEVNPVPLRLSLSFLHDSDLIIRQSAVHTGSGS